MLNTLLRLIAACKPMKRSDICVGFVGCMLIRERHGGVSTSIRKRWEVGTGRFHSACSDDTSSIDQCTHNTSILFTTFYPEISTSYACLSIWTKKLTKVLFVLISLGIKIQTMSSKQIIFEALNNEARERELWRLASFLIGAFPRIC